MVPAVRLMFLLLQVLAGIIRANSKCFPHETWMRLFLGAILSATGDVPSGTSALGFSAAVPGERREPSCLKAECLVGRETHRRVPMAARAAWRSPQWTTKVGFSCRLEGLW